MRRISTTTRISLCLASLAVGVLLVADFLGMIPDTSRVTLKGRAALCEAVALQSSSAMLRGDTKSVSAAIKAVAERNPDILSAAIRRGNDTLLLEIGEHHKHWKPPPGETSTITHVRVPIFADKALWGTVEIAFKPLDSWGWAVFRQPIVRLVVFVALAAFFSFLSYLYKVLQYLDPTMVIPQRVKVMLDTLAEGVLVLDSQERILLANQAFARATGERAEDIVGSAASKFAWQQPSRDAPASDLPWRAALREAAVKTGVPLCLQRPDGMHTFNVNAAPIGSGAASDRVRGALVTFDDVTPIEEKNVQLRGMLEMLQKSRDEINRQNQELVALAMTDPLTGCLNRRSFFSQFESQWGSARRYAYPLACVMVDVDHFKRINDQHGHSTGDQVLQHIAAILRELVRDSDLVCRYGGEEFCILLHHTDENGAKTAAERFRERIESKPCGSISMTVSVGVATLEMGASSPQEMLNQADEALYAAKRAGRNRVHCWDPDAPAAAPKATGDAAMAGGAAPAGGADGAAGAADTGRAARGAAGGAATGTTRPAASVAQENLIPFHAVTALMSVLGHRDKATAAHSHRVADLCVATANGLLSAGECFVLEVAALLHDIGKLGVPDAILLKPGALTEEEWQIMRRHDRMGAEILQSAFGSEELTRIVRTHHSWYSGAPANRGMPRGESIPLAARILTICDAYDAMVSDRPYRKGCGRDDAFAELRRCAGTQFDPDLVERFIEVVKARTQGKSARPSTPVEEQSIAGIQRELERLAQALEMRDLSLLAAVAGRLSASAQQDGLFEVARLANSLEKSASMHPDVADIVEKINDLMAMCLKATGEPAKADRTEKSLPSAKVLGGPPL